MFGRIACEDHSRSINEDKHGSHVKNYFDMGFFIYALGPCIIEIFLLISEELP